MNSQQGNFVFQCPAHRFGLAGGGRQGNYDVAQHVGVVLREGKHVGGLVLPAIAGIERLNERVVAQNHADFRVAGDGLTLQQSRQRSRQNRVRVQRRKAVRLRLYQEIGQKRHGGHSSDWAFCPRRL